MVDADQDEDQLGQPEETLVGRREHEDTEAAAMEAEVAEGADAEEGEDATAIGAEAAEGEDAENQDEEAEAEEEKEQDESLAEAEIKAEAPGSASGDGSGGKDDEVSEPEVDEDLKDAVEGSLRLKRLLSNEFGPISQNEMRSRAAGQAELKKRRLLSGEKPPSASEAAKVTQLLRRWGLTSDDLTRHVLENLSMPELLHFVTSQYCPELNNMWKSPAELVQNYTNQMREAKGPHGGPLDIVSCFKFRWKLDLTAEKRLRSLPHKELRYVLREYDGTESLDEVISAAADADPEEECISYGAAPSFAGVPAMGRYTRLELIDPLADCAVFGDANLSFAVGLARQRKALGHVGRVIATTFENLETLKERYKEIEDTIKVLEEHYAEVFHCVDCTRIALDARFQSISQSDKKIGAVYYNFPHAGAVPGFFDGHPIVNWRHENLMRLFFRALRSFVKPGGSVKVSSNSGAVGVRFSYIIGSAVENEFVHTETMPFLQWHLHRYGRSYGDRRDVYKRPGEGEQYDSQRAESDMVYCFVYRPSGKPIPKQCIRLPPTFKTMMGCTDGALGERNGASKRAYALDLYNRFVTEISGVHVG